MIEDVYEPLAKYRDEFKEKFARPTREKFKMLTATSGINVSANRRLAAEIKSLETEAESQRGKKTCSGCLMTLGFVGMVAAIIVAIVVKDTDPQSVRYWIIGAIGGFVLGVAMIPLFNKAAELLANLESAIASKKQVAWEQMAPLNRLYTWDITVKLIEAPFPSWRSIRISRLTASRPCTRGTAGTTASTRASPSSSPSRV